MVPVCVLRRIFTLSYKIFIENKHSFCSNILLIFFNRLLISVNVITTSLIRTWLFYVILRSFHHFHKELWTWIAILLPWRLIWIHNLIWSVPRIFSRLLILFGVPVFIIWSLRLLQGCRVIISRLFRWAKFIFLGLCSFFIANNFYLISTKQTWFLVWGISFNLGDCLNIFYCLWYLLAESRMNQHLFVSGFFWPKAVLYSFVILALLSIHFSN